MTASWPRGSRPGQPDGHGDIPRPRHHLRQTACRRSQGSAELTFPPTSRGVEGGRKMLGPARVSPRSSVTPHLQPQLDGHAWAMPEDGAIRTCAQQQPPIDTTARSQTLPACVASRCVPQTSSQYDSSSAVVPRVVPGWHATLGTRRPGPLAPSRVSGSFSMARDAALKAGPGQTTAAGLADQSVRLRLRYLDSGCYPSMTLCDTTHGVSQ